MYVSYNANPIAKRGNDCTIRAISTVMEKPWEDVYMEICLYGLRMYDMPSSNAVWGSYLTDQGFSRHIIPNTCPHCYTVKQFADDHPRGSYILALHGHVVACIDGKYIDSWDSGDEIPLYYWTREE